MRKLVGVILVPALLSGGCRRLAQLPDATGAKSVILAIDDGTNLAAYASSTDLPFAIPVDDLGKSGTPFVSLYTQSLDELGLLPGEIALPAEGALARALPAAMQNFAGTAQPNGTLRWDPPAAPPRFLPLWVAGDRTPTRPCPALTIRPVPMPPLGTPRNAWITFGVADSSNSALFATDEGCFFRVSTTSTETDLVSQLSGARPHGAGFRSQDGVLWLGECPGMLDHVRLGDAPDPPSQARCVEGLLPHGQPRLENTCMLGNWVGGSWVIMLDGPPNAAPEFALSRRGTIWHLNGNDWVQIHETEAGGFGVHYTFLTWTGPGEAILTHTHDTMVLLGPNGEENFGIQAPGKTFGFMRAVMSPNGILLSTWTDPDMATFFSFDRAHKSAHALAAGRMPGRISTLIPIGEGFVFGGDHGSAGWFEPDTGLCSIPLGGNADRTLGGMDFYYGVAVNPHQVVLFGYEDAGGGTHSVWWLERP